MVGHIGRCSVGMPSEEELEFGSVDRLGHLVAFQDFEYVIKGDVPLSPVVDRIEELCWVEGFVLS